MLADDDAAAGHQGVGSLGLGGDVEPGVGVGHVHDHVLNHGLDAQEEGGVAGDDLGIGISADVADLDVAILVEVLGGEGVVGEQLSDLHAGDHAGDVAGLIDLGEGVGEVVQAGAVRGVAGHGDELNLRELGSGLLAVGLMAVAVGEHHVAARVGQVGGGVVAGGVLSDGVLPDDVLGGNAQDLGGLLDALDVRVGVALVLVADEDHANLQGGGIAGELELGSGGGNGNFGHRGCAQHQDGSQDQCKNLFHLNFPLRRFSFWVRYYDTQPTL